MTAGVPEPGTVKVTVSVSLIRVHVQREGVDSNGQIVFLGTTREIRPAGDSIDDAIRYLTELKGTVT